MLTSYQHNLRSQLSDNRPGGARKVGTLNGTKAFQDVVSLRDKIDYYSFKLTGRSSFKLSLTRLQNNVDVFLLKAGRVIDRAVKRGNKPEAINTTLDAGTYYVRVDQKSGTSRYRLTLNAAPLSNSNPSSPKLVSLYRPAAAPLPRYGLIDLSTGNISELPLGNSVGQLTLVDIASSGSDTFAIDLLGTFYRVDTSTGNYTRLGDLGGFLSGVVFNSLGFASSGTLYSIGTNKNTRESGLYTLDVSTGGRVTLVANLPGIVDVGDLAYDAASSRFFASASSASTGNSLLYSIGLAGDARLVGDIGFAGVGALLFDNGILYGYDSVFASQQRQLIINTTTGVGTVDKLVTSNNQPASDISGGA
jgi:Bacterial pre-peptidase C-terminal domain